MTDTPPSPDLLNRPAARGEGVRRLNRVPLMIAMGVLALIMATIFYTYYLRLQQSKAAAKTGRTDTAIGILAGAPDAGYIPPKAPDTIPVLPAAAPPACANPGTRKAKPLPVRLGELFEALGAIAPGPRSDGARSGRSGTSHSGELCRNRPRRMKQRAQRLRRSRRPSNSRNTPPTGSPSSLAAGRGTLTAKRTKRSSWPSGTPEVPVKTRSTLPAKRQDRLTRSGRARLSPP